MKVSSITDVSFSVKNIKKMNETSEVVRESVTKLFDEGYVVIPDAYIDLAHRVTKPMTQFKN